MNKKNFDLLLESMREGGEILRGERKPSRRLRVRLHVGPRFVPLRLVRMRYGVI